MAAVRTLPEHADPSALRIAFVAGTRNPQLFQDDPSFIYRCQNLGLALQRLGHQVSWLHWSMLRPRQRFDVTVFHRPRYSLIWRARLWWLRRQGTILLADVDDLIFDPALARHSPGVVNGLVSLAKTARQFAEHRTALQCFDRVTVSTGPLAEHVRGHLPQAAVRILPNAVHLSWLGANAERTAQSYSPVVTYFPGTRSHDRDFAVYADGVANFLAAHREARLEVTGPLNFHLQARPGQVVRHEKMPFVNYADHVRLAWVNLAPLEPTPFTRCKSALKVLETGFWGIPTVCSPLPDAERFVSAGAVFAPDGPACFAALQALTKPSCYAEVTRGLSERVLARADVREVARSFLQFVRAASGSKP
jgi:hypothetical protein